MIRTLVGMHRLCSIHCCSFGRNRYSSGPVFEAEEEGEEEEEEEEGEEEGEEEEEGGGEEEEIIIILIRRRKIEALMSVIVIT